MPFEQWFDQFKITHNPYNEDPEEILREAFRDIQDLIETEKIVFDKINFMKIKNALMVCQNIVPKNTQIYETLTSLLEYQMNGNDK